LPKTQTSVESAVVQDRFLAGRLAERPCAAVCFVRVLSAGYVARPLVAVAPLRRQCAVENLVLVFSVGAVANPLVAHQLQLQLQLHLQFQFQLHLQCAPIVVGRFLLTLPRA